jgi:hypothetical protein
LTHERVTEEVRELAAIYALGALTQHEARSFELHLRDCPICKSELRKLEHASVGIGLAVKEIETPEYLRELLLARIEREPMTPVSVASPNPDSPASETIAQIDRSKPKDKRRGSKLRWALWIALIVSILANLLAFYNLYSTQVLNGRLQTELAASKTAIEDLRIELEDQKKKPADLAQILKVAGKPGMRIAWLAGQPPAASSSGTLFWDTEQHRYLLMGFFPPAPQGKAYQLWFVTPATKVSAGLIETNPDGPTYTTASIPIDSPDVTAVGITLEPDGGSPMPTTRFCARGQFN